MAEGIRAKKAENFSEWYTQVVDRADLADTRYNVQGFIVQKTWSVKIIREIYRLLEGELEAGGHEPVVFPLVIPEENLKKEGEHFGFVPEVFWVTETGVGERMQKRLALRPTSETAFYQMYALWVRSYRDLPMRKYQSVSVYRNEPVTRPFIRGREFMWVEAHDAFGTHEEALEQIGRDVSTMRKVVWDELGIPVSVFKRPAWDKFLGAQDTFASDVLFPDGKVLQIGSTHDLAQKFSIPFGIKFTDKKEEERFAWQTTFGPGVWRIFASLIATHGDDKGLVLPFAIAPTQIVIVPIFYDEKDRKKVMAKAEKIRSQLKGYRVEIDARDKTPGEKFNHWEMFGVPVRIELGGKEASGGFVTVFRRDTMTKEKVADRALARRIDSLPGEILENLRVKAETFLESRTRSPKNRHDFLRDLGSGSIARAPFCGREECAKEIQNETKGAKVRGTLYGKHEKAIGKCIYCNHVAKEVAYIAKQY